MRVIFLGSPEFGLLTLEKLLKHHDVVGVVTQPDSEQGRGQKLTACPVANFAKSHGLNLMQFEKISRDGVEVLKALNPDIMVTCAYGQILSQGIIDIPKFGIVNVHASLLPKYRGASPIQTAIINGEKETGVTIMKTEIGLDTGDIINSQKIDILDGETAGELSERLSSIGADLLIKSLDEIEAGTAQFTKQPYTDASITKKLTKLNCTINFERTAGQIVNLIRGANPDPVARTELQGQLVKIYRARVASVEADGAPGSVHSTSSAKIGLLINCGTGVCEVTQIQFPGGKIIDGKSAVAGRKIKFGDCFSPYLESAN